MATSSRTRLLLALGALAVAALIALRLFAKPHPQAIPATTRTSRPARIATTPQLPRSGGVSLRAEANLPDELPPDHSWNIPTPTAEWMTTPADPILTEVTLDQRRHTEVEITPGGGTIDIGAGRNRFRVYFPPGALLLNQKVALTVVEGIEGLPFAAGATAIRIQAAGLRLLKPATLKVEPQRRRQNDPVTNAVAFKIDPRSRELHLVPLLRTSEMFGPLTQDRYQIIVSGSGIYGVSFAADPAEVESARRHLPSDPMDRIEAELERAVRQSQDTAAGATVSLRTGNVRLISAGSFQVSEDEQQLGPVLASILHKLRDMYDQDLMPKLNAFEADCNLSTLLVSQILFGEVLQWISGAELFGVLETEDTEMDPEKKQQLQAVLPVYYQILGNEVALRNAYFHRLREEFARRKERLWQKYWDELLRMYSAIVQCCKSNPESWMPRELMYLHKTAAAGNFLGQLGGQGYKDIQDCGCAVNVVEQGEGWEGTITHAYIASGDTTITKPGYTNTVSEIWKYDLELTILGQNDEQKRPVAFASATGAIKDIGHEVWHRGSCSVDERGGSRELNGTAETSVPIHISFVPDGKYYISYAPPVARGLQVTNTWSKTQGCANPHANRSKSYWNSSLHGVTAADYPPIEGKTDDAMQLKGSETIQLPSRPGVKQHREARITWEIAACRE